MNDKAKILEISEEQEQTRPTRRERRGKKCKEKGETPNAVKRFWGPLKLVLRVLMILSTLVFPGFMCGMSASGWLYNARLGNYPDQFLDYAYYLYAGAIALTLAVILCMLGIRETRWLCSAIAIPLGSVGMALIWSILSLFMTYADNNFSGQRETLQPISEIYQNRIAPCILPFAIMFFLSLAQLFSYDARVYRKQRRMKRLEKLYAPAPRILD